MMYVFQMTLAILVMKDGLHLGVLEWFFLIFMSGLAIASAVLGYGMVRYIDLYVGARHSLGRTGIRHGKIKYMYIEILAANVLLKQSFKAAN